MLKVKLALFIFSESNLLVLVVSVNKILGTKRMYLQLANPDKTTSPVVSVVQMLHSTSIIKDFILSEGNNLEEISETQKELIHILLATKTNVNKLLDEMYPGNYWLPIIDVSEIFQTLLSKLDEETRNLFAVNYVKQKYCLCGESQESELKSVTVINANHWNCRNKVTVQPIFDSWRAENSKKCNVCRSRSVVTREIVSTSGFCILLLPKGTAVPFNKENTRMLQIGTNFYSLSSAIICNNGNYVTIFRRNKKWHANYGKHFWRISVHEPYLTECRILLYKLMTTK